MPETILQATCKGCNKPFDIKLAAYNRAMKVSGRVTCSQTCAGLLRRQNKTKEQKKAEKAAYDAQYREKNHDLIKVKKHAHFKKTYDPVEAAKVRKLRMPKHIEYCRQPKYKQYKKEYDRNYRARKEFGEYGEAHLILNEIESLIDNRKVKFENGLTNKSQNRKRKWKSSQQTI